MISPINLEHVQKQIFNYCNNNHKEEIDTISKRIKKEEIK